MRGATLKQPSMEHKIGGGMANWLCLPGKLIILVNFIHQVDWQQTKKNKYNKYKEKRKQK